MSDTGTVTTTTYVLYLLPGAFVPEESVREAASRDPREAVRQAPAGAYAFRFYDRQSSPATSHGGSQVRLIGPEENRSGTYYIDGETLTCEQVAALGHSVLLENMRSNRWPAVVRCLHGNFQPFMPGDALVSRG